MIYRNSFTKKTDDFRYVSVLIAVFIIIVASIMLINGSVIWGSETDWINQHFALPEYFRMRFYKTGDLLPDFSMQLGGGQNIYNFAYYGLLNPLYLPAYLMPWVTMAEYIQTISLLSVISSSVMCFFFLKRHYISKMAFFLTLMFMCSAPVLFHSHRHIMFINYFPFLFAALISSGNIESIKSKAVLIISSYCILCTSFYFSISAFSVIIIYSVYILLKRNNCITLKQLVGNVFSQSAYIVLGSITAGVLWLPTFVTLLKGREKGTLIINILEILIPTVNLQYILYDPYSVGMTSISIISVIALIRSGDKASKFLSFIFTGLICCPFIVYICNGTMYIDPKILIPFLPVMIILCGEFFTHLFNGNLNIYILISFFSAVVVMQLIFHNEKKLNDIILIADASFTIVSLIVYSKVRIRSVVTSFVAVCFLTNCIVVNAGDTFISEEKMNELYSEEIRELADKAEASDEEFYRFANDTTGSSVNRIYNSEYYSTNVYSSVSNSDYRSFRFGCSQSENSSRNNAIQTQPHNVIFNIIMNCRYRISKKTSAMYGETIEDKIGEYYLFKNRNAFPIGYSTSRFMSENTFSKLNNAEKAEALLENIIIPENAVAHGVENCKLPDRIKTFSDDFSLTGEMNFIKKINGAYEINSDKAFNITAKLKKPLDDKLIIISLCADNRIGKLSEQNDIWISINGVKNKLSDPKWKYRNNNFEFSYVLSSDEPIEELAFQFSSGNYLISDIKVYLLDTAVTENALLDKDIFTVDRNEIGGDIIKGRINASEDGWFNLSVPYDDGFKILVDGEKTVYVKTNTAFIGFPITRGEHEITLIYSSHMKAAGIVMTMFGLASDLFVLTLAWSIQRRRKTYKRQITVHRRRYSG